MAAAAPVPVNTDDANEPASVSPADPANASTDTPADPANTPADPPVDPGPACTLGTAVDCAQCGDPACALQNTLLACTSADQCASAVCAAGFANCNTQSPDCETSFAAGGACLPGHLGTAAFPTDAPVGFATAIGTDGSFFWAGPFRGTQDLDPSDAQEVHSAAGPADLAAFITKFNADGSYAWSRSFSEPGVSLGGLAAAADGAVVAAGVFVSSIDLDPGPGTELHQAGPTPVGPQMLIVKLAADGSLVWGRSLAGTGDGGTSSAGALAVDASGAVYVAGLFTSTIDFDPGSATALRTAPLVGAGMVVKLTPSGDFSWVQTIDDGQCGSLLRSLALATDGTLWAVGSNAGNGSCEHNPSGLSAQPLIAAYSAAGDARGIWRLPVAIQPGFGTAVAAGANGSVYIGGQASGLVDLDPGPGVAMRWAGSTQGAAPKGGFILKLAPDASLLWAQAFPGVWVNALASTSGGGVLAAGTGATALVATLGPDGTPGWAFALGGAGGSADTVAVRGSSFMVAGSAYQAGDFDPGPGTQLGLDGGSRFVSRFGF